MSGTQRTWVAEAQRDVRRTYVGGFHGQLVSSAVWLSAAAAATWASTEAAIVTLFLGGTLIFPLTWMILRWAGGPASLPHGHPMRGLAVQIAFTVPIGLVVVVALLPADGNLFFPASMVIVGAHYLPFVFLYGMRAFAVLSMALVVPGVTFMVWVPVPFPTAGWLTGVVLLGAAFLLRLAAADVHRPAQLPIGSQGSGQGTRDPGDSRAVRRWPR